MDTYSNPQESPELGQFLEILSGPWQRPWRWSWGHLQVQTSREKLGYPLVMTNTSPWYRWSIEIDGLPIKKWWFSMATLNNQMVTSDHQKVMWLFPASPFLTTRVSRSSRCSLKDKKRCDSSPRRRHAFCRGETGDFKQPEMDKWGVPRIHGKIMGTSWTKTLIIGF